MIEYIIVFVLSIFCTYLAEKYSDSRNLCAFFVASFFAILLPSALAGIRDSGIGYDTEVYGNFNFEWLSGYSRMTVTDFFQLLVDDEFGSEWLYMLWIFLSIKYTGDIHWYYFFLNFFVCLFTYLAIYNYRKKASMPLMMFVFFFSFYNISLSAMRQSMALALALYSYHFFETRNWKILIPLLFMVYLFHNSGMFFIVVLLFIWLQQENYLSSKRFKWLILLIPISFTLFDPALKLLVSYGIFPQKFVDLYSSDVSKAGFMAANTLLSVMLYLVLYVGTLKLSFSEKNMAQIYLNNHILYVIFLLSMLISLWAFRISYYFYYMNILFIPAYLRLLSINKVRNAKLIKVCAIFLIIFIWLWTIIFRQENATYPYESDILKGLF